MKGQVSLYLFFGYWSGELRILLKPYSFDLARYNALNASLSPLLFVLFHTKRVMQRFRVTLKKNSAPCYKVQSFLKYTPVKRRKLY